MNPFLAIEVSSPCGSLALFRDGMPVAERTWTEERFRNQHAFEELQGLLAEADTDLARVQGFAVGRGPGTFSSLRIALSLAQSAALPDGGEVYALSSGEALAAEVMDSADAARVAVVGDARRGSFWYAVFARDDDGLPCPAEWKLCPADTLLAAIPRDAAVVTSCRERLLAALPAEVFDDRDWIEEDRFPGARWVGKRYLDRSAADLPSEPLSPLYMHPPVR